MAEDKSQRGKASCVKSFPDNVLAFSADRDSVAKGSRSAGVKLLSPFKGDAMSFQNLFRSGGGALLLCAAFMQTPVAAQEPAAQVYIDYVAASLGKPLENYAEQFVETYLDEHIKKYLEDHQPELNGRWTASDLHQAVTEFGAPTRAPFVQRTIARLSQALSVSDAKANIILLTDAASQKTIFCMADARERTVAAWTKCAKNDGRRLAADEQAVAAKGLDAISPSVFNPDMNSALVGIMCHTLDRFSEKISEPDRKRTLSITMSVTKEESSLSCDHAKPRYAALIGLDAYMKLEPTMQFAKGKGE